MSARTSAKTNRKETEEDTEQLNGNNEKSSDLSLPASCSSSCRLLSFILFVCEIRFFHTFDDSEFSDKYFVRGIDVSHHNSFINWEQLRDENVTFVYLKSTEGMSHKDKNYKSNYRAAKTAGLKVGTYHFTSSG